MGAHIYNLQTGEIGARPFYQNLTETTSEILDILKNDPAVIHVNEFRTFISDNGLETPRNTEEYLIEYMMIGLFWKKYSGYASGLSGTTKRLTDVLYSARQKSPKLKDSIDKLRGKIATRQLIKKDSSYEMVPIVENLEKLIGWLDATKDFREEVKRLRNWLIFFKQKSPIYISRFLNKNKEISEKYIEIARANLGSYTRGVKPFTDKVHKDYKNREDIIFCSRSEDEYFFNMIAAEILNRAMKSRFDKASRKIVLLPTCMSSPASGDCKSKTTDGLDIRCAGCTSACRVNEIKNQLAGHDMEARLIPHATSFSKYLRQWAGIPDVGIVGVACVLNLLSGGYEMISLGIPSQCVFLDFCGCMKHWPGINQPTDLNTDELKRRLNINNTRVSNLEMILN